ncbi:MAG: hypothetical protein AAFV45_11810 [Pseudomonadota bacterium]
MTVTRYIAHFVPFVVLCIGFPMFGAAVAQTYSFERKAHAFERKAGDASPRFHKSEHVLAFINDYRDEKSPDDIPDLVHAMVRLGVINDPEKSGVYTGFLAGVIQDNQVDAPGMIAKMFPLPPAQQVVLIKAVVYSELPNWKALLETFAERMPARKVMIHRYLYGDGKALSGLPLDDGFTLDVYWGMYFATGNWAPAVRIIDALQWAGEKNDVEKLTIGSMAKWTYATNATRDKNLLDLAKRELNHRPEELRGHLREVIDAAELFETRRLREAALKSIDELRQKGPQRVRDLNTWGQAGQTVLALGCVGAAALGQAQFGVPCVLGGALSSAALKYLLPKP